MTLSADNRIVLPREAREKLGVKAGDKVDMVCRGKVLVLTKVHDASDPERPRDRLK